MKYMEIQKFENLGDGKIEFSPIDKLEFLLRSEDIKNPSFFLVRDNWETLESKFELAKEAEKDFGDKISINFEFKTYCKYKMFGFSSDLPEWSP